MMQRAAHWLLTLTALFAPLRLSAQTSTTTSSSVRGVVVDENNKPVPRASVAIDNPAQTVQADAAGKFLLANVTAGRHVLSARAVGFQAINQPIQLKAGEALDVDVELTRITALETNNVVGRSAARAEFDDRRARKLGFAIDSTILNNRSDMFSALSRIPLTTVKANRTFGISVSVRTLSGNGACTPAAFVDGKMTDLASVTALDPDHFRAIEVLPYEAVPGKYYTRPCVGAILFWSKNVKW